MFWRRKRRRRRKISKIKLFYHLLIVVHLSLILLLGYSSLVESVAKRAAVKYMVKGWLSQWEWHWIIK